MQREPISKTNEKKDKALVLPLPPYFRQPFAKACGATSGLGNSMYAMIQEAAAGLSELGGQRGNFSLDFG